MASSGSEGSDTADMFTALVVQSRYGERKLHSRMLRFFNFEVDQVENGREAVDLFVDGEVYDLIIIEKTMPIMDGIQAIRHIRLLDTDVKILALSESMADRVAFLEAGAHAFLPKPLTFSNLFVVIARLGFLQ